MGTAGLSFAGWQSGIAASVLAPTTPAPTSRASITGMDYYVTTETELANAVASAVAGDTITMQNRTWSNLNISIGSTANHGTSPAPITLRAETGGSVILNQISTLELGRDYLRPAPGSR